MSSGMHRTLRIGSLAAATALALTACGSSYSASPPASSAPPVPTTTSALKAASTSLGQVVVDGAGMTVYTYDADHQGTQASACTGGCASTWPAVLANGTPTLVGVTGTVGTIPAAGGGRQVTLNGWPLYTYAEDTAPGQVSGQGSGGTWWAVSPSGSKITTPASTPSRGGGSGGGGYGGY